MHPTLGCNVLGISYKSQPTHHVDTFHFPRLQVLYDLFRHNLQLWNAYSLTIQVRTPSVQISRLEHLLFHYTYCASAICNVKAHEAFAEYQDLLEELDGRLSSTDNAEGT